MTFLYNPNGNRTVMHLAEYSRLGAQIGALCGEKQISRACNLPLGQPIFERCREVAAEFERSEQG